MFPDGENRTLIWYTLPGLNYTDESWSVPNVTDNSGNVTVTLISGPEPGDKLYVGEYVVIYEATDPTGNKANFTIYIYVLGTCYR